MAYPSMSTDEFQNANIAILACQLFMMVLSFYGLVYSIRQSKPVSVRVASATGGKL